MSEPAEVLRMEAVCKRFASARGAVEVLRGVDLSVRAGEFVMVTGPSGSGKSTLLNLAALLDRPTSGCVWIGGRDASAMDEEAQCALRREKVGMVFQNFCLLGGRTAAQNVRFRFRYADRAPDDARARADAMLARMGLADAADRPVRLLSQGEMQRVAIARAVVSPPSLLLADEPTGNLDAAAAEAVMGCFAGLHAEGMTILMVTHNPALLRFATRRLVCADGRLADPRTQR